MSLRTANHSPRVTRGMGTTKITCRYTPRTTCRDSSDVRDDQNHMSLHTAKHPPRLTHCRGNSHVGAHCETPAATHPLQKTTKITCRYTPRVTSHHSSVIRDGQNHMSLNTQNHPRRLIRHKGRQKITCRYTLRFTRDDSSVIQSHVATHHDSSATTHPS